MTRRAGGAQFFPMPTTSDDPKRADRGPGQAFDIVAFASSAGGVQALTEVLSRLPADFPAAIVAVQHLSPRHESLLSTVLGRKTSLRVADAEEGRRLGPGSVLIAPRDRHVTIGPGGAIHLTETEKVQHVRPSADVLLRSVAEVYGARAIAVVLSGTGHDAADGVRAIHRAGGVVVAQDEATSQFFGMPDAAIRTGDVAHVLPLEEIPETLARLVRGDRVR